MFINFSLFTKPTFKSFNLNRLGNLPQQPYPNLVTKKKHIKERLVSFGCGEDLVKKRPPQSPIYNLRAYCTTPILAAPH